MDNLTHSLIGIAVAQWAGRSAAPSKSEDEVKSRNSLWMWTSILGNNFPDLDVLYTAITPGVLGRLLHHRGHTHTLIAIIPQIVFILLFLWFFNACITRI